jgi:enoyl-CoA hydratase/carnithine racemase
MKTGAPQTEIKVAREGEVAVVTLNRPEKRNALSLQMMRELGAALAEIARDPQARVVILRGEGPAFCAGHDLRELVERDVEAYRTIFDACIKLMARITAIPQPVIAEVAKVATAAGCQLVAACDLAVASTEATFATPGVRIGLFCSTPMVALTRAIGRKRAMEMLLTGDAVDAPTALAWGEPRRCARPASRRHARAGAQDRILQRRDHRNRKSRVLPPDRSRSGRRIRVYKRSHDVECAGTRRARRHLRVSRKASAAVALNHRRPRRSTRGLRATR